MTKVRTANIRMVDEVLKELIDKKNEIRDIELKKESEEEKMERKSECKRKMEKILSKAKNEHMIEMRYRCTCEID